MSFYDFAISQAELALTALEGILKKGAEAPNAADLPQVRLHADMLPLAFQVHVATDIANKVVARLTGQEPASNNWEDLKTFDDFYSRIAASKRALGSVSKDDINASTEKTVPLGMGPGKNLDVSGFTYVTAYGLPNIYFHVVTVYNILRKEGVALGKLDYLAPYMGPHMPKE